LIPRAHRIARNEVPFCVLAKRRMAVVL